MFIKCQCYVVQEDGEMRVMAHQVSEVVERSFVTFGIGRTEAEKETRYEAAQGRVSGTRFLKKKQ